MAQLPDPSSLFDQVRAAQQAYAERRLVAYLDKFSSDYFGVQLHTDEQEDFTKMHQRVAYEMDNFDLLNLDYRVITHWFAGDQAFLHTQHYTRLRYKDTGRVMVDMRENVTTAKKNQDGV